MGPSQNGVNSASEKGCKSWTKVAPKMDPKRALGGQNGLWDQNHVTFSIKMDTKSDPAKTTKNRPRHATHENTKNTTKSMRECKFDPPKTQKHYKTAKKVTKKSPKTAKRSKMSRTQVLLKNRSKSVIREHTLHTCTREKRFSKAKFEKTILNRDRMKKWHIWGEISIFVRVLQCI